MIISLQWQISKIFKSQTSHLQGLQLLELKTWQTIQTRIHQQAYKLRISQRIRHLAIPYFNNSHLLKILIFLELYLLLLKQQALDQLNRIKLNLKPLEQLKILQDKASAKPLEIQALSLPLNKMWLNKINGLKTLDFSQYNHLQFINQAKAQQVILSQTSYQLEKNASDTKLIDNLILIIYTQNLTIPSLSIRASFSILFYS